MDRREPARSHLRLPRSVKVGCVVVLFRGTVVSASKKSKPLKKRDPTRVLPAQSDSTLSLS